MAAQGTEKRGGKVKIRKEPIEIYKNFENSQKGFQVTTFLSTK